MGWAVRLGRQIVWLRVEYRSGLERWHGGAAGLFSHRRAASIRGSRPRARQQIASPPVLASEQSCLNYTSDFTQCRMISTMPNKPIKILIIPFTVKKACPTLDKSF